MGYDMQSESYFQFVRRGAQKALYIDLLTDPYSEQLDGSRLWACWFGVSNSATQPAGEDQTKTWYSGPKSSFLDDPIRPPYNKYYLFPLEFVREVRKWA